MTMIERVARAIEDCLGGKALPCPVNDVARAAIAAMRAPTKRMLSESRTRHFEPYVTLKQWQDMIDAALEDK